MRRELQALVLLLVILGAALAGWQLMFERGHRTRVILTKVQGDVQQVDEKGSRPAVLGDGLEPKDRLVAGAGGQAVLSFGQGAQVTLQENATVELLSVEEDGVRLSLEGGRVEATVHPGDGNLDILANGQDILATDADFSAGLDGDGNLAVRTDRGEVSVAGTPVSAGNRIVVPSGGSASVSDDLLLSVDWPTQTRTNAGKVPVEGRTEPGAMVTVVGPGGNYSGRAGADGHFRVEAPLQEGHNPLQVKATSILGDQVSASGAVDRDTTAPTVQLQIRDK